MLNRRLQRIKVFKALYSYIQSENENYINAEKELFYSIEKLYDLYIHFLELLIQIHHQAKLIIEEKRNKKLPSFGDMNPNFNFVNNIILEKLSNSKTLDSIVTRRKVSWSNEHEYIRNIFIEFTKTEQYLLYIEINNPSVIEQYKIIKELIFFISKSESLLSTLEEKSIYWIDDIDVVKAMSVKTIKQINKEDDELVLIELYKDDNDDRKFIANLFRRVLDNYTDYNKYINDKLKNWDIDRVAIIDLLLMKMAICEFLEFPIIPTTVTMNEYIELSKIYSTPKSNIFINGILDKIIKELTKENKINKFVN
ncbi:MAG: transcription antitermination factor NusB [Bacteroidetes bacterium GWE2_29_8]|nr:MAG: transcription antitermination factor NusB [Bacteroidetes bacterium GWE2_29_8]